MHLYNAGLQAASCGLQSRIHNLLSDKMKEHRKGFKHYLESYHYLRKSERMRKTWVADKKPSFLDSGAFSAYTMGVHIDVGEYAEFIKEYKDTIRMASVLDAIGDENGTYVNQVELERRGIEVLPCFHFGEPLKVCEYYANNYEYITIGGMVPVPNAKLEPWLDEVWGRVLTDKNGYAKTKVHGFGMTSRDLMLKYPWYSVDSSSWVQIGMNGGMILPSIDRVIHISKESPNRKKLWAHYDNLPEIARSRIDAELASYGVTANEIREEYWTRWIFNAMVFDIIGERMGEDHWRRPFKATQGLLFT